MLTLTEFYKKYGVKITTNHNDKMQGLSSVSTACHLNRLCIERALNKATICSHCYAMTMQKRFQNLRKALEKNTEILTSVIIPENDLPRLFSETGFFRFEAFGDLINEIQVVNYFNMAKANAHMKCALWNKNPFIIARAIKKYNLEKPENLVIIGSSYFVNEILPFTKYAFIDKVFTVYDKKYIEENGIEINCGGRSCASCGLCYENKGGKHISEMLK